MTDAAVLVALGERLARHRLAQNLTQAEVAREAGVSPRTVARIEAGESTQLTNFVRVIRALGLLGHLDALVPPPTPSPIDQVRTHGKQRRRASARAERLEPLGPWAWGDEREERDGRGDDRGGGKE